MITIHYRIGPVHRGFWRLSHLRNGHVVGTGWQGDFQRQGGSTTRTRGKYRFFTLSSNLKTQNHPSSERSSETTFFPAFNFKEPPYLNGFPLVPPPPGKLYWKNTKNICQTYSEFVFTLNPISIPYFDSTRSLNKK